MFPRWVDIGSREHRHHSDAALDLPVHERLEGTLVNVRGLA